MMAKGEMIRVESWEVGPWGAIREVSAKCYRLDGGTLVEVPEIWHGEHKILWSR